MKARLLMLVVGVGAGITGAFVGMAFAVDAGWPMWTAAPWAVAFAAGAAWSERPRSPGP